MKSSKKVKPKPKAQFHGIHPPANTLKDVKSRNFRVETAEPSAEKNEHQQSVTGNSSNGGSADLNEDKEHKIPQITAPVINPNLVNSEDDKEFRPKQIYNVETDVWVNIKTVDSKIVSEIKDEDEPVPHSSNQHDGPKNEKKVQIVEHKKVKHVLEYQGREMSITDLLPTTLGQGTEVIFNKYSMDGRLFSTSSTNVQLGSHKRNLKLVVEHGIVLDPSKVRKRRPTTSDATNGMGNSFAETHDLGPPGALQRWLINIGKFYDNEVTLTLDGNIMTVEAFQNTRPGQTRTTTESFEIPISFEVENLRVYKNRQIGTLIIAYMPRSS